MTTSDENREEYIAYLESLLEEIETIAGELEAEVICLTRELKAAKGQLQNLRMDRRYEVA
jgi:hypothetical protein